MKKGKVEFKGEQVGRGGRGRGPRGGNDEHVDELNGGATDFSTIISQQLQNLLPAMLTQVGTQGNVGNQHGNVVNENVQENVGNVIVNGNRPEMQKFETELLEINPMFGAAMLRIPDSFMNCASALIDEAVRNGSIKKVEKKGKCVEPSKVIMLGDENGVPPAIHTMHPEGLSAQLQRNRLGHWQRLNRAQGPEGNRPNQVAANNGGQGRGNQGNQARDNSNPTTAIDMALELIVKAFQLNNTTPTNNNQRSSSNPRNSQIAQPGMHTIQERQMLMVDDNVGNHFRQNAVQNVGNVVGQNAVQNPSIQNVGNHNGLTVIPGISNQYGNGSVVAVRAEVNGNGIHSNQIRCYNCQGKGHYTSNYTVKPRKRDVAYCHTPKQGLDGNTCPRA
ncbi:hypothetical protein Tco_1007986 [Tanacetum coccineum]